MDNSVIRISSLRLTNFKNVENGKIDICNDKELEKASILGVYGQNGSGKTAIVDALKILRSVLCGVSLNNKFAEYINVNAESSKFEYSFILKDEDNSRIINIDYGFEITKAPSEEVGYFTVNNSQKFKVEVSNESLRYSISTNDSKTKKQDLILTDSEDAFGPKSKYEILTNGDKNAAFDLMVAKKLAKTSARSFIFCKEFLDIVKEHCQDNNYLFILNSLYDFGNFNLFVIDTANTSLASLNALVLNFNIEDSNLAMQMGQLFVPLSDDAVIPELAYPLILDIINNMNIVLYKLIPGLTIRIIDHGSITLKNGQLGRRVQLLSHKNEKNIPLRYESEGTKKIIAILQLLINMYNNSSTTVVIDEIDAGVFEYLLGELLQIIASKGKGQLIFTSHNLRPLEKINKSFIVFTTTNPNNRYVRMPYVKTNNNLRNLYFRDIYISGQEEKLYSKTDNEEIICAFQMAGNRGNKD